MARLITKTKEHDPSRRRLRRGLFRAMAAGALGGLAGSYGMDLWRWWCSGMRQEPAALQLAETISVNIVHHRPTPPEKKIAASVVHFGIATGMGALYGGLAEMGKGVAAGFGTGFRNSTSGFATTKFDCRR